MKGTDLVIGPLSVFRGSIDILVNTSSIHHPGVDIESGILSRVGRDVITPLERSLDQIGPFLVRNQSLLSIDCWSALLGKAGKDLLVALTPLWGKVPLDTNPSNQVKVDLSKPVISIGAPSRGVAGRPLLPAFAEEPFLSIQVLLLANSSFLGIK
jgi:hypothetical protein